MYKTSIYDLEELIKSTRNSKSKEYILEALHAYYAGAFNSAVCSIWIAVVYDIISKIREISIQGDKNALAYIEKIDNSVEQKNILSLIKIEQEILDKAHQDFEFISYYEHKDLQRLKEDRNLCAHPAFITKDELFKPTKELVRTHLVHSIIHLLSHRPVQGKSAIDGAIELITSESFPDNQEDIMTVISEKYIDRAKESFIRNFTLVLWKALINNNEPNLKDKSNQVVCVINAISDKHPSLYRILLKEKFDDLVSATNDHHLLNFFILINNNNLHWEFITESNKIRLKQIISIIKDDESPAKLFKQCFFFTDNMLKELESKVMCVFSELSIKHQMGTIHLSPHPLFCDIAIRIYAASGSYSNAEWNGKSIILPMSRYFTKEHVKQILQAFADNDQIYSASGSFKIIEDFFDLTVNFALNLKTEWVDLLCKLSADRNENSPWAYPGLRKKLISHNLIVPTIRPEINIIQNWKGFIDYVKARKIWMAQDLVRGTPELKAPNQLILKYNDTADYSLLNMSENLKLLKDFLIDYSQTQYDVRFLGNQNKARKEMRKKIAET